MGAISIPGVLETKQTVDPAVSIAKFERELSVFKSMTDFNRMRGVIPLKAEFPNIILLFLAYKVRPTAVAFTVRINFNNYDVEPPSIQFIDPITEQLLSISDMSTRFPRRTITKMPVPSPEGQMTMVDIPGGQDLLQFHPPHHIPFLCLPGTREYHEHPYHSNDPWLDHRGKGEGTLGFIVDQLHKYGTEPIIASSPQAINVQNLGNGSMVLTFNGLHLLSNPDLLPL